MYPRASRAGNGFIRLSFALGWIVRDPALHIEARCRAAINKSSHTFDWTAETDASTKDLYLGAGDLADPTPRLLSTKSRLLPIDRPPTVLVSPHRTF